MFCKHCGGDLRIGQRSCGRCGAEVEILSNCGGFYDLVQVERPAAPVVQSKKSGPCVPVLLGVVAVLLVLVVLLVLKQNQLTGEIESLQNELEELAEEAVAEETTEELGTVAITLPDLFNKEEPVTEGPTESEV